MIDDETRETLEQIVNPSTSRSSLDNRHERAPARWDYLATTYFNNEDWAPENLFLEDERVNMLDPSRPPVPTVTGQQLQKMMSKIKTEYTVVHGNFHQSGNLMEGEDNGE